MGEKVSCDRATLPYASLEATSSDARRKRSLTARPKEGARRRTQRQSARDKGELATEARASSTKPELMHARWRIQLVEASAPEKV